MFGLSWRFQGLTRPAVVVAGVLLVCGVGSSAALAARRYVPVEPTFGLFAKATGITVDQSNGNVYVADSGANDVQVFGEAGGAPSGGGPSSFTGVSTPAGGFNFGEEPSGPAAANGTVYVSDVKNNLIDKLLLNGAHKYEFVCELAGFGGFVGSACLPNGGAPAGAFHEPLGAALDSSGDLYIADFGSSRIYEYNASGEEVAAFSSAALGSPQYLTVASNGTIYAEAYSSGAGAIVKFTRSSPTGAVEGEPVQITQGTGIAYDNLTSSLFVDTGSSIQELDGEGKVLATFGAGIVASGGGVAVNETTGSVYAVSNNTVQRFRFAELPIATTLPARSVANTTAELCGTVNPESGTLPASYQFQYGTTNTYGSLAPASPVSVGTGEAPQVLCTSLTGLEPAGTYHFRIVATNGEGEITGGDETFTTHPWVEGVTTGQASFATTGPVVHAILHGSLEPNGQATNWWFEYGHSEALGSTTPTRAAGSEHVVKQLEETIGPLEPNATYYFKLIGENTLGRTAGQIVRFQTPEVAPVITGAPTDSGIGRVSALLSGTVNPENSVLFYHFIYGTTASYGSSTPVTEAGSGHAGEEISQQLERLTPNTTYHYALVLSNPAGEATSSDQTFVTTPATPPVALTGAPSAITTATATLTGSVNPSSLPTTYTVQIGTDTTYGGELSGAAGSGPEVVPVSVTFNDLQPGMTYHYRVLASNEDGASYGADQTFTTAGASTPLAQPPAPLLVPTPQIQFPATESTITKPTPKSLTNAQKLAKALKACAKEPKKKHAACQRQARKQYTPGKSKKRRQ